MPDATVTCTVSPCTVVVQITHPLLDLTPEQGAEIALAIVGVWAIGVIYRMLSMVLNDGDHHQPERE